MDAAQVFDTLTPSNLFNMPPVAGVNPPPPSIARSSGPAPAHEALFSPDNPLFWFAGLLAATLGLIALSGSIRVGPASASASLGKK